MNGIEATALINWTWDAIVIGLCAVEDPDYADGILKAAAVAVITKHQLSRLVFHNPTSLREEAVSA